MEGTEIVINFAKAAEITKELHSGDFNELDEIKVFKKVIITTEN